MSQPSGSAWSNAAASKPAAPESSAGVAATLPAQAAEPAPFDVERVLDVGISALAVERPPHVAALSARAAFIHTAKGWHEESLPQHPHFSADAGVRELFYGRDYRVRLIANVETEAGPDRSYFRWLPGGFRPAKDELGPLARNPPATPGGSCPKCVDNRLIAVLGNEDPEIICRPRDVCVVKRVSGWSTFKAPEGVTHAAIFQGKAYLLAGQSLLQVEGDKGVTPLLEQAPWSKARSLVVVDGIFWVLDASPHLYRFDGRSVRTFVSPVGLPQAAWGATRGELWIGGERGLALFDGERFRPVSSVSGEVTALGGRGADEVWIGGSSGLYCATRRH